MITKKKKIVWFIDGPVPTKEDLAAQDRLTSHKVQLVFRNAQQVGEKDSPELCDAVGGAVPVAYKDILNVDEANLEEGVSQEDLQAGDAEALNRHRAREADAARVRRPLAEAVKPESTIDRSQIGRPLAPGLQRIPVERSQFGPPLTPVAPGTVTVAPATGEENSGVASPGTAEQDNAGKDEGEGRSPRPPTHFPSPSSPTPGKHSRR